MGEDKRAEMGTRLGEREIFETVEQEARDTEDVSESLLLRTLIGPTDGQVTTSCLYHWAEGGFPVVEMGHKFAASLLVSHIPEDVLDVVKIPWPGMMIQVPQGLITTWDPSTEKYIPITRIFTALAHQRSAHSQSNKIAADFGGNWQFIGFSAGSISLWRFGMTPKGLVLSSNDLAAHDTEGSVKLGMHHTDVDSRMAGLIGRLIIATCIAMTMKEMVNERVQHRPKSKKNKLRSEGGPTARFYVVGKPINLDFRERVQQYAMGTRATSKELSVQHMVGGHFKQQPFGEGRMESKTIWVEPYWRGPEDAAIPIRAHVIKEE
jgi:hypothetical protein